MEESAVFGVRDQRGLLTQLLASGSLRSAPGFGGIRNQRAVTEVTEAPTPRDPLRPSPSPGARSLTHCGRRALSLIPAAPATTPRVSCVAAAQVRPASRRPGAARPPRGRRNRPSASPGGGARLAHQSEPVELLRSAAQPNHRPRESLAPPTAPWRSALKGLGRGCACPLLELGVLKPPVLRRTFAPSYSLASSSLSSGGGSCSVSSRSLP